MATIKFFTKGTQNPATIYLRFSHGRKFDLKKSTTLLIERKNWNNKKGCVKQVSDFTDKRNLQNELNSLKTYILNTYNNTYATGTVINRQWLTNIIDQYFNQDTNKDFNYFDDYAEYFLSNLDNKVLPSGKTGVGIATKKKYKTVINKLKSFKHIKNKN